MCIRDRPNGMISEIVNYSATDVSPIVMIPISPNENYKVIEEKLLRFLPTLKNKYDIFVSAPELLGLDSVDGNEMVIKLLAHVKPGMHFPGQRLLRKEVIQYFSEEGIHIPKPTATPTTPAPAKIADTLIPKRESIDVRTINHTT